MIITIVTIIVITIMLSIGALARKRGASVSARLFGIRDFPLEQGMDFPLE